MGFCIFRISLAKERSKIQILSELLIFLTGAFRDSLLLLFCQKWICWKLNKHLGLRDIWNIFLKVASNQIWCLVANVTNMCHNDELSWTMSRVNELIWICLQLSFLIKCANDSSTYVISSIYCIFEYSFHGN